MRFLHLPRPLTRGFDLHQIALADPRTPRRRLWPLPLVIHQLRPKREDSALRRLHRMDRTSAVHQKMALHLTRDSQPKLPLGAINIAPLKLNRPHPQKLRDAREIGLRQVYKSFLRAAIRAAGLAFESQALHAEDRPALVRNFRNRSIAPIRFSYEFAMLNRR